MLGAVHENGLAWLGSLPEDWSSLGRQLSSSEISQLEEQGCRCVSWDKIRVSEDFVPRFYERVRLEGICFLSNHDGQLKHEDQSFDCGVRDVRLSNVYIDKDVVVERCGCLSDVYLSEGVLLFDLARLVGIKEGWSKSWDLEIGNELGGRLLSVCPEMTLEMAKKSLRRAPYDEFEDSLVAWRRFVKSYSILGRNVKVFSTPRMADVCLAEGTTVDRALHVEDVITLAAISEPVHIGAGAQLHRAYLQWGSEVSGGAQLKQVVLGEQSSVENAAIVENAYLGPNNHVGKGEITASLLGPFVGMHHQSLVIGVIWPEGMGNVSYGANVGSNHTGKAPDQEFFPGEGCFLGLSSSIKFPAHFRKSPFTMVSTGVTTLPQRLEMPFSLINARSESVVGMSPALNELMPAWMLGENLYALIRNEVKFMRRNKARRYKVESRWLRSDIVAWMQVAREGLLSIEGKSWYDGRDLPILGKNMVSEAWRKRGAELYGRFVAHYACDRLLVQVLEEDALSHEALARYRAWLLDMGIDPMDTVAVARHWLEDLELQVWEVRSSKERDFVRGRRVMDDYDEVHEPVEEDAVLALAEKRLAEGRKRCHRWLH